MSSKKKDISVRIDEELVVVLDEKCAKEVHGRAFYVEIALRELLKKNPKEVPNASEKR